MPKPSGLISTRTNPPFLVGGLLRRLRGHRGYRRPGTELDASMPHALMPSSPSHSETPNLAHGPPARPARDVLFLSSPVIDTHCHLTFPDFHEPKLPGGIPRVLADANAHGVTGCISISTTSADCVDALELAHKYPNIWCSAGVHPLYSDRGPHDWATLARVAASPRCVAWGELGLDNHYNEPARDIQHEVLHEQLEFIQAQHVKGVGQPGRSLPIVVHCREAFADLLPVLRATKLDPTRFVFHCFTGTPADMRTVLDFGALVSFTGVATYRNAADVREAMRLVPDDRIMIETDAPFLSPEPHRGTRPCQPWMASVTAAAIAQVRATPLGRLLNHVNRNTALFFSVGTPE